MAVESHQLRFFPSVLLPNGVPPAFFSSSIPTHRLLGDFGDQIGFYGVPMESVTPVCNLDHAATVSKMTRNDVSADASAAEAPPPQTKRRRVDDGVAAVATPFLFLGEDLSPYMLEHQLEIDNLVAQHAEKLREAMMQNSRRISRQILKAAAEKLAYKIRAMDTEIDRIAKLNRALEEQILNLAAEKQIWCDLAQRNEAAANLLRSNLAQAIAAKQIRGSAAAVAVDDAESCCDNGGGGSISAARRRAQPCRICGQRNPAVLLLPCRHLCVCLTCAPAIANCPVCRCVKDGSIVIDVVSEKCP